jgi:uncharacterized membrane protein YeiH
MEIDFFYIASFIGSVSFALSGVFLSIRKKLDIMGMFIIAMLTANGGGVLRDVLIGEIPGILIDISAFYIVLGVIAFSLLFKLHKHSLIERKLFFVISDSIGLVAFSITGAIIALEVGLNLFGVITLAFLSATGGGLIRDILLNEVPTLFHSGFYGSISILVSLLVLLCQYLQIFNNVSILVIFTICFSIRMLAHYKDWHLPKIK